MGGQHWTTEDQERLRIAYPAVPKSELVSMFPGRTFLGIRTQANLLGLRRNGAVAFGHRRSPLRRAMTEAELAYIAGIIDGEGHITFIRSVRDGKYVLYTPRVGVTNQSEDLICWLDDRIAWTLRSLKVDKTGWGWAYRPALVGHSAAELLHALLPYLLIKRVQAELVIQFCEQRAGAAGNSPVSTEQVALAERVRALNRKRDAPTSALSLSRLSA